MNNTDKHIYLDYAASTPLDSAVKEAMEPYWNTVYGNPSSSHTPGQEAKKAVEDARSTIAGCINARPEEIIFTSGGTESNSLALFGFLDRLEQEGRKISETHIITSSIEHPSVRDCFKRLEKKGYAVSVIGVDSSGVIDRAELTQALRPETALVSIMQVNNEIGTIQSIAEIAKTIKKSHASIIFHVDASQSPLFLSLDVEQLGVDLLTIDAQKLYGPKGVGALYIRRGIAMNPLFWGGKQERGLRPGTHNVPGIVGFARACEIAQQRREEDSKKISELRDYMIEKILTAIPGSVLNGSKENRLPNNVNISFPNTESEFLVLQLDKHGIAAASKSACLGPNTEGSYVVNALNPSCANSAIRFSLGRENTKEEIDRVVEVLRKIA